MTPKSISPHILAVDDDPDHLAIVARWLERADYKVTSTDTAQKALTTLEVTRPDLVLTDLVMSGMDGLRLLSEIHRHDPVLPVIILSGDAQIPDAMKAAHLGVSAFLTKPIAAEALRDAVDKVLKNNLGGQFDKSSMPCPGIIYRSYIMTELMERARLVAQGDTTALINGETGTGKEIIAKAIHDLSQRHDKPFISLNCSALPEQLMESELFGHEKGAFTGALYRHEGMFQAANNGTLFLDEIGDMPLSVQAKLLRVLQDFQVRAVGSTQAIPVNVRIISATNQDLESLVEKGEFREDLFYRLNVVPLKLPPLRDRREDIPLLIEHFLSLMSDRSGKPRKRFSPDALEYLFSAHWPGNIRQLQNVVEQCTVLCTSDLIPINLAKGALRDQPGEILPLDEARLSFDRRYLVSILRATAGNVTAAARLAGRNRTEFYKLLAKHGLEPAAFRNESS